MEFMLEHETVKPDKARAGVQQGMFNDILPDDCKTSDITELTPTVSDCAACLELPDCKFKRDNPAITGCGMMF